MAYVAFLTRLSVRSWRQAVSVRSLSASGEGKEGIVKKSEEVSRDVEEVKPDELVSHLGCHGDSVLALWRHVVS